MARLARIIVPGIAHHVTQRGNRREPVFFEAGDQEVYRDLLAEQAAKARVSVGASGVAALLQPSPGDEAAFAALRGAETTGRPLGNDDFIKGLERLLGRPIARRAPGRKPAAPDVSQPPLL